MELFKDSMSPWAATQARKKTDSAERLSSAVPAFAKIDVSKEKK